MTSVYAWGDQTPAAVSLPVHPNSGYGVTACSMSISFACLCCEWGGGRLGLRLRHNGPVTHLFPLL
jgi:hypothetical protein